MRSAEGRRSVLLEMIQSENRFLNSISSLILPNKHDYFLILFFPPYPLKQIQEQ